MEEVGSDLNAEMKVIADNAIQLARDKFGQELDFSEQGIDKLENILDQIYQTFSKNSTVKPTSNEIDEISVIWGSYLGEYMCRKWGGTWTLTVAEKCVSVQNVLFSPIRFLYNKLTIFPDRHVDNYLNVSYELINASINNQQQPGYLTATVDQPKNQNWLKRAKIPLFIQEHTLPVFGAISGVLLIILVFSVGYINAKSIRKSTFVPFTLTTNLNAVATVEKTIIPLSLKYINRQSPTITVLPTYTSRPSTTPHRSFTPSPTYTVKVILTLTETQKQYTPTKTQTEVVSPTESPWPPAKPSLTSSITPSPTSTRTPSPTVTRTPSPTITRTATPTATRTPSPTVTRTPSPTITRTATPTATRTPSPTVTRTPSPTATRTASPTATRIPSPTVTFTPSPTATRTVSPTATLVPSPTLTPTPSHTATVTSSPTITHTPRPTNTPRPTPTSKKSATPSYTPLPPTETPVTPTDTQIPPTDTEIPPTDTQVPPTDTELPPSDTPISP
jgi:hypothetical protein